MKTNIRPLEVCVFLTFLLWTALILSMPRTALAADIDLKVTYLSVSPSIRAPGGSISISYRVHNDGLSDAPGFDVNFYYSDDATITTSDTLISSIHIPSLAAGANYPAASNGSVNTTLPGVATPGVNYIGALADPAGAVTETDENNNTRATTITVLPPPPDVMFLDGFETTG